MRSFLIHNKRYNRRIKPSESVPSSEEIIAQRDPTGKSNHNAPVSLKKEIIAPL
jgi:hypothetical protein